MEISFEIWIPKGIVGHYPVKVVGEQRVIIDAFPYKWFNVDVYNDGPDDVYCFINEVGTLRQPLKKDENLKVENPAPLVKRIILFCDAGKSANVRIYTKR